MIALRGRVQLRKRGPEAENPPVDSSAVLASDGAALVGAASAPSTVTTDEKPNHKQLPLSIGTAETSTGASCTEDAASSIEEWEWSGEWSFGTIVDEKSAPNARLPFSYTWIRPVAKKTPEPAARN
jgi:hypothetical protein